MIEYDDEDDCLVSPAFHVGDCTNVDVTKPPTSGAEYLQRVHLESKKCPQVVVANLDLKKLNSKQTVSYSESNGFTPAPPGLAPDEKTVNEQVSAFSSLRVELSLKQKKIKDQLPPVIFPDISDRFGWCEYCLGSGARKKVTEQILKKSDEAASSDDSNSSSKSAKEDDREKCEGHDPLLSVMLHLPHSTIEKLLAYHLSWLQCIGFSVKQGQWIFSLLALLQKPLRPETCDLLRRLARACSVLRADIKSEMDENLFGLNHIISLVSRYFDQKDMSDDFVEKCVGRLLGRTLVVNEDKEISDEGEEFGSEEEEEEDDEN